MATKKCPNGHQYDSGIYGDNCPFCPESSHTRVNAGATASTQVAGGGDTWGATGTGTGATIPVRDNNGGGAGGGHTVIRVLGSDGSNPEGGRKVVGVLASYTTNPSGEIYKIYEGRNMIGRVNTNDIIIDDDNVSKEHLLIFFNEAEGVYWAKDQFSSNGTYINGRFARGETEIKSNDVIVIGKTKLIFLAIPDF